jgi:hypothetical protein
VFFDYLRTLGVVVFNDENPMTEMSVTLRELLW